jgi:hypothetical protein
MSRTIKFYLLVVALYVMTQPSRWIAAWKGE